MKRQNIFRLTRAVPLLGAAMAICPPIEAGSERLSRNGQSRRVEQTRTSEVQHDFGYSSGKKDLNGREVSRPIGKAIDKPGYLTIQTYPIAHRGPLEARCVSNCRHMK